MTHPRTTAQTVPAIGVTMGDPHGIGPEILLKALTTSSVRRLAHWVVIGDHGVLERTARRLHLPTIERLSRVSLVNLANVTPRAWTPGRLSVVAGRASYDYLQEALHQWRAGAIEALVTAPVTKAAIQRAGISFLGHTEWLARSTRTQLAMMLLGGPLRVVLVTRHLSLRDVPRAVTPDAVRLTVRLTHHALRAWFGLRRPRIAIASLNPHAGEAGSMGTEELTVLRPVVAQLARVCPGLDGPIAPDAAFYAAYRGRYDAVVCMYHDQALIPLKMIARDGGVNITLGLPFVRTSPDHGTALDIAGRGIADPGAMIAAMTLAAQLARRRS